MANHEAYARTNYVRFKDLDRVKAIAEAIGAELVEKPVLGKHACHALFSSDGFTDHFAYNNEDDERNTLDELSACLADNNVLIIIEVGHERLRYVSGYAIAINAKGERRCVALGEIYGRAKELASPNTSITEAEY